MTKHEKMKRRMLRTLFAFTVTMALQYAAFTQPVVDLKTKTASNERDRTAMLDILRAKLYEEHRQEFVFVVKHFKMGGTYAWFEGEVQRKDGKQIRFDGDGEYDCCMVTSLFKKSGSKWYIVESGAFGTDVWWTGVGARNRQAPRSIFPADPHYFEP